MAKYDIIVNIQKSKWCKTASKYPRNLLQSANVSEGKLLNFYPLKTFLFFLSTFVFSSTAVFSQVSGINLLYNSIPGIGCYASMSVCTTTGTLPESGAEIIVDWMDGDSDTLLVFSAPNSQNCYLFEHAYSQAGSYNALVTVHSATAGGQLAGSSTIEWVITNTSACGFFNVISMLTPSGNFLQNVPYDVTDNAGVVTTIYPQNSFGNPYYTELNVANTPYTVGVSSTWLQNNGYTQSSPDFVISAFGPTGQALGVPMNMTIACNGTGVLSDLEITSAAAFQFLAPLQTGQVSIQVCNVSCGNYANSVIQIAMPTGVVPDLSNLSSATYQNDTVTIVETYLSGCMTYSFPCSFAGNTPAGTLLNFTASVLAQGEQDLLFNQSNFVATVLNSYDPNDKQCHLPTNIDPFEQENLGYTVRFQNDGNYPALNVEIRDTISTQLDLSTFRLIASKHPVSYTIDPNSREIVFRFSGIQLQPSQDDLEGSQGYVTYALEEVPNLPLNAVIENTAYIYFDFNPAIITNTTFNINGFVGVATADQQEITLYPNPTHDGFYIYCLPQGEVTIYSISGQYMKRQKFDAQTKIDLSEMQIGVYLVQVEGKGVVFISKTH